MILIIDPQQRSSENYIKGKKFQWLGEDLSEEHPL